MRFASRPTAFVADAYAALNFAAHHLVQYLHYAAHPAHASAPHRARRRDLAQPHLARHPRRRRPASSPQASTASSFARRRETAWSRCHASSTRPSREEHGRWFRSAAALGAAAVACALVGAAVDDAVDYHPTYVDRLKTMEQRLAETPARRRRCRNPLTNPPAFLSDHQQEHARGQPIGGRRRRGRRGRLAGHHRGGGGLLRHRELLRRHAA